MTHEFEVRALCPVDGSEDVYVAELTTNGVVPVEHILKVAPAFAAQRLFQETLTQLLFDALRGAPWSAERPSDRAYYGYIVASVTTHGTHSGVKTTVTVGH